MRGQVVMYDTCKDRCKCTLYHYQSESQVGASQMAFVCYLTSIAPMRNIANSPLWLSKLEAKSVLTTILKVQVTFKEIITFTYVPDL